MLPTASHRTASLRSLPLLIVSLALAAVTAGKAAFATPSGVAADIRVVAREAYVWGWPLVYLHHCRVALERVPAAGRSGGMPVAPLNRLSMLTDRISPRTTRVPCPNQDVIYGFGMFDLADDAVVVDATHLSLVEVVDEVVRLVRARVSDE